MIETGIEKPALEQYPLTQLSLPPHDVRSTNAKYSVYTFYLSVTLDIFKSLCIYIHKNTDNGH